MNFETKFEEFAYNKRMSEFFEKVYNHEPIALLNRRDYKTTDIFIKDQAICGGLNGKIQYHLSNISNKDIDFMAHLYASYQLKELKYFIEDAVKDSSYLDSDYSINIIGAEFHNHIFYSEETIERFKNYNKKIYLEDEEEREIL